MAGEWRQSSLGDLCDAGAAELQTGPFGTQLHAHDYVDDGVPVVPTEALRERRIDHSVLPMITETKALELSRHRLEPGDILFARRGVQATGHIGCVRQAEDGFICGTGAIRLRIQYESDVIDADYLSHVLANPSSISWFKFHAIGATMPNLNEGIIRSFPLSIPPLPEQRAIARILGSLHDKIDLNRRMSETLEAMARALFKAWFVDFAALPGGVARQGLDPRNHAESGWRNVPLDSVATFLNGLALQRFPANDGPSLPVIKIAQLRSGNTSGANRASADIPDQYIVSDGDVVFSWSGTLECEQWTGGPGALNQHLFRVTSDRFPKWFYYLWIREHLPEFRRIASGKATTMGHIQRHHLTDAEVVVPSHEELKRADATLCPLLDRALTCNLESRTLAALRDTLLPKLISGELRIKDAELLLEAAPV